MTLDLDLELSRMIDYGFGLSTYFH